MTTPGQAKAVIQVNLRLPQHLYDQLVEQSREIERTQNECLVNALEIWLSKKEKKP